MAEHFPWLDERLKRLQEEGLVRRRREVVPLADGWCVVEGKKLRNFAANDYLNLAHDARVIEAARNALEQAGAGSRASALVTGRTDWHVRLENELARFEGQEAALLFPTGYAANIGTITALSDENTVLFCDRLNHASLIDGCRLSEGQLRVYRHDRLEKLERELRKFSDGSRKLIVTDSLFSMDGDPAPLTELCQLAEQFQAQLIVDEAHATGVFGLHGRGIAEEQGVEDRVAVRIGTLSKGIGSLGGFVTGPQKLIDWLWNRARTQMFSTALPPSACAAAAEALKIIEEEPWRREHLLKLSGKLHGQLREAGLQVVPQAVGPIVPVILNDPERAITVAGELEDQGFLVAAIRPPTVPQGTSRLRITLTCAHAEEDIDRLVEALSEIAGADSPFS